MGYRANSRSLAGVCQGNQELCLARPHASHLPVLLGAVGPGLSLGSICMSELFPWSKRDLFLWIIPGCNGAHLGLVLAGLSPPLRYRPCVFLLLSHGQHWRGSGAAPEAPVPTGTQHLQ